MRRLLDAFLRFIYPPFCLHCAVSLQTDHHVLCESCLSLLELVDPEKRCILCFAAKPLNLRRRCSTCRKNPPLWQQSLAALEYAGPAKTLLAATKYGNQPFLTKGQAAFMVMQLLKMNIPFPDLIVPLPLNLQQWLQRGYNENLHLAQHLGKMIARPVYRAKLLRFNMYKDRFVDKNIFLVGDILSKGQAFQALAERLWDTYPRKISVFTVCC